MTKAQRQTIAALRERWGSVELYRSAGFKDERYYIVDTGETLILVGPEGAVVAEWKPI